MKKRYHIINKRILSRVFLLTLIAIILPSCVSIETTSYSDPAFIAKPYTRICVYSVETDLNKRSRIESMFVDEFLDEGITAVEGSMIFPPTRKWNEEDFQSILIANKFDAFLKVEILHNDVSVTTNPVYSTDTYTSTKETEEGETETITETRTSLNENKVVYLYNKFQADLIDVETNKIAWRGFSSTEAEMTMGIHQETVIEKFAESVIEELEFKRHILVR